MTRSVDYDALLTGNRRALAKAITLVESRREDDREASQRLLNALLPIQAAVFVLALPACPGWASQLSSNRLVWR